MSQRQIIKKIEKEFDYVRSKVMEMRLEAEHMAGDARERFGREVDGLKSRVDRLEAEFSEDRGVAGLATEVQTSRYQQVLNEIKEAFKAMRDRFK